MAAPKDGDERNQNIYFMTVFLIDFSDKNIKGPCGQSQNKTHGPCLVPAHRKRLEEEPRQALLSCGIFRDKLMKPSSVNTIFLPAGLVLKYESNPVPYVVFFYCCHCFRGATFSRLAHHVFHTQACEIFHSVVSVAILSPTPPFCFQPCPRVL